MQITQHQNVIRQTRLAFLLIFFVVMAWFSPWWLGGKVLAPLDLPGQAMQPWSALSGVPQVRNHFVTDAITQYLPYRLFAEKSYREDGYIGWNSLTFQGFAQDANTMGLFSDWTMQLHRWLPFWTAWHVGLAAQFLIAGWGMLVFLRHRGISPPAAWASSVAYMGNAQFIIWIYHRWALSAFCWLPWLLWAIYRAKKTTKWAVAPPIFLALALCGGTLQHGAFTFMAFGAVAIGFIWEAENPAAKRAHFLRFTLWLCLGIALAAFYLIPATQAYLANLESGNLRGKLSFSGGWKQPLLNLLSYPAMIFPWIFGRVASLDLWKIWQSSLIDLGWFGFLPTFFGLVAIFWKKTPLAARLLMLLGWIVPLTPLGGPLYHRVVLLSILGGVWSFCLLLESEALGKNFYRRTWIFCSCVVALWTLLSVGLAVSQDAIYGKLLPAILRASASSQFGIYPDWTAERLHRLLSEAVIWHWTKIVPLTLAFFALVLAARWRSHTHFRWFLGVVISLEMTFFFVDWTTWSDFENNSILPPSKLVDAIEKSVGVDQLLYQPEVGPLYLSGSSIARLPLVPNVLQPLGVPVLTGYESIMPPRIWQNRGFPSSIKMLEEIGVTHILQPTTQNGPVDWSLIFSDGKEALWENPQPLPHYRCFSSTREVTPKSAKLLERTENRRIFEVPARTMYVEIVENWNRGWHYRLSSGDWLSAQKSAYGNLLLPIENRKETTIVELRYFPGWLGVPGAISAFALLLLVCGKLFLKRLPNDTAGNRR